MATSENDDAPREDGAKSGAKRAESVARGWRIVRVVESSVVGKIATLRCEADDGRVAVLEANLGTLEGSLLLQSAWRAMRVFRPQDTRELHGIPFLARIRKGKVVACSEARP